MKATKLKPMRLEDILFSQGFGTRRVCAGLVQQGHVQVQGETVTDSGEFFDLQGLHFNVQGTH
jgi:16S rRNA pseudouridine516 synthase